MSLTKIFKCDLSYLLPFLTNGGISHCKQNHRLEYFEAIHSLDNHFHMYTSFCNSLFFPNLSFSEVGLAFCDRRHVHFFTCFQSNKSWQQSPCPPCKMCLVQTFVKRHNLRKRNDQKIFLHRPFIQIIHSLQV